LKAALGNNFPILKFQNDREHRPVQSWALICETLLSRNIKPGIIFQLRQGDVSLLIEVHPLPHLNITEEVIDPRSNKFLLKLNPETPV
jgi:vang-like